MSEPTVNVGDYDIPTEIVQNAIDDLPENPVTETYIEDGWGFFADGDGDDYVRVVALEDVDVRFSSGAIEYEDGVLITLGDLQHRVNESQSFRSYVEEVVEENDIWADVTEKNCSESYVKMEHNLGFHEGEINALIGDDRISVSGFSVDSDTDTPYVRLEDAEE